MFRRPNYRKWVSNSNLLNDLFSFTPCVRRILRIYCKLNFVLLFTDILDREETIDWELPSACEFLLNQIALAVSLSSHMKWKLDDGIGDNYPGLAPTDENVTLRRASLVEIMSGLQRMKAELALVQSEGKFYIF